MKRYDVVQGTEEWLDLRKGIPTASRFHRILTPQTRKLSGQATDFAYELLAEWHLGHPLDWGSTPWMDRGGDLEAEAVDYYEFQQDAEVERVGFCTLDDGTAGASPDGLADDDGGLEIKCPSAAVHTSYLLGSKNPAKLTQVQGNMWITGRKWWDVLSYNPAFPPVLIRVHRDEQYIRDLAEAVRQFNGMLGRLKSQFREMDPTGRMEEHFPFSDLSDDELEAFEELRRSEPQDVQDTLVQMVVNGDFADVRKWMARQRVKVAS